MHPLSAFLPCYLSLSNFCGFAGNYGAVLELSADLTPTLHTHWAPPLASFGYGKVVLGLEKVPPWEGP